MTFYVVVVNMCCLRPHLFSAVPVIIIFFFLKFCEIFLWRCSQVYVRSTVCFTLGVLSVGRHFVQDTRKWRTKAVNLPHRIPTYMFCDTWSAVHVVFVCLNLVLYPLLCRGGFFTVWRAERQLDIGWMFDYKEVCAMFKFFFFPRESLLGQQSQMFYRTGWSPPQSDYEFVEG